MCESHLTSSGHWKMFLPEKHLATQGPHDGPRCFFGCLCTDKLKTLRVALYHCGQILCNGPYRNQYTSSTELPTPNIPTGNAHINPQDTPRSSLGGWSQSCVSDQENYSTGPLNSYVSAHCLINIKYYRGGFCIFLNYLKCHMNKHCPI